MNVEVLSASEEHRAPSRPFRLRDFRRVVALAWPYRKTLAVGLLFTVLFAGLHTASISGAFPVFKILLEPEGLRSWADRFVAEERLGIEFAPVTNDANLRVVRIHRRASGFPESLSTGVDVADANGESSAEWLRDLADAPSGATASLAVDPGGVRQFAAVTLTDSEWSHRLLRRIIAFVATDDESQKIRTLLYVLVAVVVATIAANTFRYFGEVLIAKSVLQGMMDLRDQLYERTLGLPLSFFSGTSTADVVTRFVQDVQEIQRGLITLFGKFVREPLRAMFLLTGALILDWRITLVAALGAPVAVAIFWWVGRSVKSANRKLLQAYGQMIDALTTTLQNLRVVKAYTAEKQEQIRLDTVDRSMFQQQLKLAKLDAFVSPMMEGVAVLAGSCLVIWLLSQVLDHRLSVSKFATLGLTLSVLFDPLRKMSDVWVRIQRAVAAAERIYQVIDHPIEAQGDREALEIGTLEQAIEYRQVTFTYPNAERPALSEINLRIAKGETVALVGPNGSGKTTLASLLPRLYDPTSGCVEIDGTDLRRVSLKSLRRQIGLVTQDAIVFAGTPTENITYGSNQPAETVKGRVEEAARRSFADEFIRALPGGYTSRLGERGSTLSGGQRQRLAIARAVYRDAPILIFDEATSQIDSESEVKIQTALREFAKGRTTIIIAHRLSTIQFADRIVIMDAGRIIDQGAHSVLFARCPLYRTLCETQLISSSATS
ncbi:MAG: ATP-binding cassette domain-containing protein [Planctomycetota bacterium]